MQTSCLWLFLVGSAAAASVRYDQTQSGDTNIHLQLKNVEVLALLDDPSSFDAEYDYDYSDFTIKPPKPGATDSYNTSGVVSSSTAKPNTDSSNNNSSNNSSSSNDSATSSSETPLLGPTPAPEDAAPSTTAAAAAAAPASPTKRARRCGSGFYRDTLGRCRRIRRPHLQMMVNLSRGKPTDSSAS